MTGPKRGPKTFLNKGGYLCIWDPVVGKVQYVHRVVWFERWGYWPRRLDHINGDRQDNRLENLREVTKEQSNQNREARTKYASKCVYFDRGRGKYRVRVQAGGVRHFIGLYGSEGEAVKAAREAIKRLHGKFARHL